ncbi:MAG: pyrimidine-nucleoside phosphorylase [Filifactoraceae bacterium]
MRIVDIIKSKRDGKILSKDEIDFFIKGYVSGDIPDYQASALLMAIYFQGMNDEETSNLTMAVANSGDIIDLSSINGIKVDKHSTGGVGDKTTLIIAPIVAACGGKVAKLSGRGLGHTGGTVDKLESVPNTNINLKEEEFFRIVNEIGLCVIGQTGNLAPADKKLYALRDVTSTVDSIPLIAASIMSKKLASGSDAILLDVKTGSGAFMKTLDDSIELAEKMVAIGSHAQKNIMALVTNMDIPLGYNIGNTLEVIEAIQILKGQGPEDLRNICIELATYMLVLSNKGDNHKCKEMVINSISNGSALEKFALMIEAQGGNKEYIYNPKLFPKAKFSLDVVSDKDGYIQSMNTESIGITGAILGAGRETKESVIDFSAGIILHSKTGDKVSKGQILATLYTEKESKLIEASTKYLEALIISPEKPKLEKLIQALVTSENAIKY